MAQGIRNGEIWIYDRSPFENSFDNTIKFSNQSEMDDFFNTSSLMNEIYYDNDYSQNKKTGEIKVKGRVDKYDNACYMRFKNKYGRMYYAFVMLATYINEDTTLISFEIDPFNTYQQEMFSRAITANVEQSTLKRRIDGKLNIFPNLQSINVGNRNILQATPVATTLVDWLVIVLKPKAQLSKGDNYIGSAGFPATYKNFRYVIMPCDINRGVTYKYMLGGKIYESVSLEKVSKRLTNDFEEGETNTVNQVVSVFTTKHIGIDYDMQGDIVVLKDYGDIEIHDIAK